MKVATLFTSISEVLSLFDSFIYSYPKIVFEGKDSDTAVFKDLRTGKHQLYYHFKINDVSYEFSYNYSEEDQGTIKGLLGRDQIFCFDLSFQSDEFLKVLLDEFVEYLNNLDKSKLISEIVISHPDNGVFKLRSNRG